jgi:hypothetical protein
VVLIGIGLLSAVCVSAQDSAQQAVKKDSLAASVVDTALTAMGGRSAIASIQDVTITGQSQSSDPNKPDDRLVWKSKGMSIRYENTTQDGHSIVVVHRRNGSRQDSSGKVNAMAHRVSITLFPSHLPGTVLLSLLNSPDCSLSVVDDPNSESNTTHIRSEKQMAQKGFTRLTRQDWYFDRSTGLPVRVEFYLPDMKNQQLDGTATVVYTEWQTVSSILIPRSLQLLYDGNLQSTVTLETPTFNQGIPASAFQLQ